MCCTKTRVILNISYHQPHSEVINVMRINPEKLLGPVADPGPEIWGPWIKELTAEQRRVLIEKEIDQRISMVKFHMQSLKAELDKLETVKSMMKVKGK